MLWDGWSLWDEDGGMNCRIWQDGDEEIIFLPPPPDEDDEFDLIFVH